MVSDGSEFRFSLFFMAHIVPLLVECKEGNHWFIFCPLGCVARWCERGLSNAAALRSLSVLHLSACGAGTGDHWRVLAVVLLLFLDPFTLPSHSPILCYLPIFSFTIFSSLLHTGISTLEEACSLPFKTCLASSSMCVFLTGLLLLQIVTLDFLYLFTLRSKEVCNFLKRDEQHKLTQHNCTLREKYLYGS